LASVEYYRKENSRLRDSLAEDLALDEMRGCATFWTADQWFATGPPPRPEGLADADVESAAAEEAEREVAAARLHGYYLDAEEVAHHLASEWL